VGPHCGTWFAQHLNRGGEQEGGCLVCVTTRCDDLVVRHGAERSPPKRLDELALTCWDYGFEYPNGEPDGYLTHAPNDLAVALQVSTKAPSLVEWCEMDMQWWLEISTLVSSYRNGQSAWREAHPKQTE
jgi:hypothetical protein